MSGSANDVTNHSNRRQCEAQPEEDVQGPAHQRPRLGPNAVDLSNQIRNAVAQACEGYVYDCMRMMSAMNDNGCVELLEMRAYYAAQTSEKALECFVNGLHPEIRESLATLGLIDISEAGLTLRTDTNFEGDAGRRHPGVRAFRVRQGRTPLFPTCCSLLPDTHSLPSDDRFSIAQFKENEQLAERCRLPQFSPHLWQCDSNGAAKVYIEYADLPLPPPSATRGKVWYRGIRLILIPYETWIEEVRNKWCDSSSPDDDNTLRDSEEMYNALFNLSFERNFPRNFFTKHSGTFLNQKCTFYDIVYDEDCDDGPTSTNQKSIHNASYGRAALLVYFHAMFRDSNQRETKRIPTPIRHIVEYSSSPIYPWKITSQYYEGTDLPRRITNRWKMNVTLRYNVWPEHNPRNSSL
jgi:hypothetical protein